MNFTQAVQSGFNKYVTFSGRAPRSEYWYWALFSFIVQIVANMLDMAMGMGLISGLLSLALLLPSIAVGIRRLHDIDRTGWWLLIAFTGIGIILLIVWACIKGTDGPNLYGPDPLGAV